MGHVCTGGAPMPAIVVGHDFSQNVIFEAISVLSANRSPASVPGRRQGYPWVVETSWRSITRGTASKNCFFTRFLVRGRTNSLPCGELCTRQRYGEYTTQKVQILILEAISALAAARPPPPALGRRQGYSWPMETSWRSITLVTASRN